MHSNIDYEASKPVHIYSNNAQYIIYIHIRLCKHKRMDINKKHNYFKIFV